MANRLGVVYAAETGFILARDPDRLLALDVAFVSKERVGSEHPTGFFDGSPDLVVEVVSPGDRQSEVEQKTRAWLDGGTGEVWVVWPQTRSVTVHRPGVKSQIFHEGDTIDGVVSLPGFACLVEDLFA